MNSDSLIINKTQLLDFLGDFFEVAINMILYTREVYPESREKTIISSINNLYLISNFHKSQAFQLFLTNYDKLRDYILATTEALKPLLFKNNLRQLSLIISTKERIALEKITIKLSSLNPNIIAAFESKSDRIEPIDRASLESIVRSFIIKLSTADSYFKPLPNDIIFHVTIETCDELNPLAQSEINSKFPWVLADTDSTTAFDDSQIIPLKSLESEVFKFELIAQEINK